MGRWGRTLVATLAIVALRGTETGSADEPACPGQTALHHDGPGALPTVGDQRASNTCVSWSVRTIAAHHFRRLARPWRRIVVRVPRWRWNPPRELEHASVAIWVPVAKPDLADPFTWPSVAYLHDLELRRTIARNSNPAGQTLEAFVAAGGDPLGYGLNVAHVAGTLAQFGAPSERVAPFTVSALELPTPTQVALAATLRPRWAKAVGTCASVAPGDEPTDLCAALQAGPALLMLRVHPDFGCDAVHEEYEPQPPVGANSYLGTHAIVVVAFDPAYRGPDGTRAPTAAFRLMNSWGTYWGDGGYTWVTAAHLFGTSEDTNLVQAIHRFDVPATAAGPGPMPEFPAGWTSGDAIPWEGDPERGSCGETPPPYCEVTPEPVPPPYSDQPQPAADRRPPDADPLPPDARRSARFLDVEQVAGAKVHIVAPAVPLVPAFFGSTVRYWVDGEPAESVDPKHTGFALRFVDRTESAPRPPAPPPASDPKRGTPGSGASKKARPDPGIGADPAAIGAFVDRAVFEIVDPSHPYLDGGRTVRVLVEVYDPCACEPRAVARYRIRVAR